MEDLGYPLDAVEIVGNIYTDSTTSFTGSHFGTTLPINISRGTIQGDTLSPYLFIMFLEPLLRWLEKNNMGYHFNTSKATCTTTAYADDLAIITDNIKHIQPQVTKFQKFAQWSYMDLNLSKCAITGCPNNSKLKPTTFKAYIQSQHITYNSQNFPILTQNEPYTYLGVHLTPSLKWNLQKDITITKVKQQSQLLANSPASLTQKIKILNTVIKPRIAYVYYAIPFSKLDIKKLDKIISKLTKEICKIPKSTANILTHLPHKHFGINVTSLLPDYIRCIGQQLIQALNDPGHLGTIYQGLTKHIAAKYGGARHLPKLKQQACVRSPIARTLFLLEREYEIHVHSTSHIFPINQTALERNWKNNPNYNTLPELAKTNTQKYLDKFYMYGITTLTQIQNPETKSILTPKEFQFIYKYIPKTIKEALQQASIIFPPPPLANITNSPQQTIPQSENTIHAPSPPLNLILGQSIQNIVKEQTTTKKDRWDAQSIREKYLCQWQVPLGTIQQWRKEEELLHKDNILLEHNILRIIQYHREQAKLNIAREYASCLNHTQSKDSKFIHPPLHITNLKLSIQECNPDKDIQVDHPAIQIQNLEAHVYDQRGNYMASISTERLQWLWNQYSYHHFSQATQNLQPPPQNFETEILWLIQRYITILPKRKPKTIQPKNMHHKIHPTIIQTLIEAHKITHSYYSSPLTCPTQLTQYHSTDNRDIIFGSMGHAQITRWTGTGLAYPTDHKTTVEAIHWARMAAK